MTQKSKLSAEDKAELRAVKNALKKGGFVPWEDGKRELGIDGNKTSDGLAILRRRYRRPKVIMIGFAGKIGAGKTTAARYVQEKLQKQGEFVILLPFAWWLKRIVAQYVFRVTAWIDKLKVQKHYGKTGREWCQLVGTDWFRSACPDIWVDLHNKAICNFQHSVNMPRIWVLVDDVRFTDEVGYIEQEWKGVVIGLTRTTSRDKHASENDIDIRALRYWMDNSNQTLQTKNMMVWRLIQSVYEEELNRKDSKCETHL